MLSLEGCRNFLAFNRRQAMCVGALGAIGLSLPQLLRAETGGRSQKSCILIYASGGPSQLDTLDPKPDAPVDFQSQFKTIATNVPGIHVTDMLPKLSRLADRFALVRSVSHGFAAHSTAAYAALTGYPPPRTDGVIGIDPSDFPAAGSVLSKLRPSDASLPSYVVVPQLSYDVNIIEPGQLSGFLGGAHAPLVAHGDPSQKNYKIRNLSLADGLGIEQIRDRRRLLAELDFRGEQFARERVGEDWNAHFERAFGLLSSSAAKRAFDLNQEPDRLRDAYGRNPFGQSYLLARRLVEAGVRMVMVNDTDGTANNRWDTHNGTTQPMQKTLPQTDAALSSLIEDLEQRGLLENTVVIWMGEMGRDPKAPHGGHWPQCYTVLMTGGGIRGGQIYGASDKIAAYPKDNPTKPGDILATMYHLLGLPDHTVIYDRENRPIPLFAGKPIKAIL